jgi:hypothetical protein
MGDIFYARRDRPDQSALVGALKKLTVLETPPDSLFSFARYEDAVVVKNHLNH